MDVEKLMDRMKLDAADWAGDRYIKQDLLDSAEALTALQIELKAMRGAANSYKAENERLKSENIMHKSAADDYYNTSEEYRRERNDLLEELEKVKAERDAAVADVCAIIGEVEEIRRGYGVDNADADDAFAGLCESYCDNYGHGCYKEGSDGYYCANFKWRGQKEI